MARSAAIPLAIAGFGSLILISGIEGQSLSEIIKGEIGKGKPPLDPTGKKGSSENPGSSIAPEPGQAGEPISVGPNASLPSNVPRGNNQAQTLLSKLESGERLRTKLEKEAEEGHITTRTASERFHHAYPRFGEEAAELKKLLKVVK